MTKSDILGREVARDFRRGLLKFFILKLLDRGDMHGYAMMARIEEISGWKPSPGSMYPALMNLRTSGMIRVRVKDMRKMYSITPKGREFIRTLSSNLENGLNEIKRIFDEL